MKDEVPLRRRRELQEDNRRIRVAFIATELDLAITFFRIAESTRDSNVLARNIGLAETAFDAARRLMRDAYLTVPEREKIDGQLTQVRELSARVNGHP